jgi:hypothetical protein
MSLTSELNKARRKRLEEEEKKPKEQRLLYSSFDIAPSKASRIDDSDIAPVKNNVESVKTETSKKDDGERKWFEKGAFADGYQFGDVTKTILGTDEDLQTNFMAGILGIGEKALDTGTTLVGGVGKLFGADEFAENTKEFVKRDLYDEEKVANKMLEYQPQNLIKKLLYKNEYEENSVLGERSDSLAQSAGQLTGTFALASAHVPWYVTSGVTSFGSEAENAFNKNASYGKAVASATIAAGAEILTEKLFGGSGLGEKGLINTSGLTRGISNKVVKLCADFGINMLTEGSEEVATEIFNNLGSALYKKENAWELLTNEEALDGYLESFVGGIVLGGAANVGKVVNSAKTGRDYNSGLTTNEQKVVDAELQNRIDEAQKDGKELTKKEKAAIEEQVLNDLQKGYISTDVIESVLGGETYKTYQDTIANEDATIKELSEMYEGAELEAAIKDITDNSKRGELRDLLSKEVSDLAVKSKDGFLTESYNERTRRTQAFTADLSKYEGKTQETIKKAVESGILNDTNRTHEFVDMIAKISADKGVSFDFVNNAKLRETGFAVADSTVNGYVTSEGVTLNIDSAKALNSVVGHEITHVLEGTEIYDALQEAVFEYAKTKGEYMDRLKNTRNLYKDVDGYKGVDGFKAIKREVVSDLVGDYLFTDADFVNNLSVQHRNVFQKIYDEIKYLCKVATAGSKEARELEKAKRIFEEAYRASSESKTADTKYSLADSDGKQLTKEQSEYFKDSKMRDENGNLKVMYHGSQDAGFHVFDPSMSDDETSLFFVDRNDVAASYSGTSETYEAQTIRTAEDMNKFIEKIGVEGYEVTEKDGKFTLLYEGDRVADSNTAQGIYKEFCWYEGVGEGDANYKVYLNLTNPLEIDAKGRNWNNIAREYSQKLADKYNSLTAKEKAALVELTEWEDFHTFRDEILSVLEQASNGKVSRDYRHIASAVEKLGGNNINISNLFSIASDNFSGEAIKEFAVEQMNTRDYAKRAKEQGYDGVIFKNIHDNGGYSNGSEGASTVAIAFNSNQIKSVANNKPTSDADIRFSLSKSVEETKDLMALHNLKSGELLKSLDLGGLPMPSIAIIKADARHDQYGDVSLILPKETIDPKANKANKVYGGDAWTPTYPKIEYKPNDKVVKKISDKYYELAHKYGYDDAKPLYKYTYALEDELNGYGGEAAMLASLYDSPSLMKAYLLDTGKGKVETVQKEIRTELSDAEVEQYEFLFKELGADVVDGVMVSGDESPATHIRRYWEQHGEDIKEAYKKLLTEEYGFTDAETQNVFANMKTFDFLKLVRSAHLYRKNGMVTTKTEPDYKATEEAIKKAAGDGYRAWVDGLFKGIEEKSGIRNNAEYFTPSGNRRSWNALHWENTLENVVRVMKQQTQTGADALFGAHQMFAVSAKNYGSIADIKADSNRLYKMSEEEYEAIKETYTNRFSEIARRIADKTESNPFIALDNAMECIVDAVRSSKTKAGIARNLKQYTQLNVTDNDIADIVSLVADISNMPTGYFEAKPQRAVGFEEVGVFVIPNNADEKLKQELLNRGYSIAEYDPTIDGDRQKVVNKFEEYKFSLSNAGKTPKSYGKYNVYGKDIKLDGAAQTQDIVEQAENIAPAQDIASENAVDNTVAEEAPEVVPEDEPKRFSSLTDADAPPETEAPYYGESEEVTAADPFESRDIKDVGNKKVKAYMYENPEVKPFFQMEANAMLGDLQRSTKGERFPIIGEDGYITGWTGAKRETSSEIAYLRDELNYTYAEIEKGLKAIIEDNGAENNACSKRIEFLLNDMLLNGTTDFMTGEEIPPNQDYIKLLNEKQITEYNEDAFKRYVEKENADNFAPIAETTAETAVSEEKYEAIRPPREKQPSMQEAEPRMKRADSKNKAPYGKKEYSFIETATGSDAVDGVITPDDVPDALRYYEVKSNKKSLEWANNRIAEDGFDKARKYFDIRMKSNKVTAEDMALGQRLMQEAAKAGDAQACLDLMVDIDILSKDYGQVIQALSMIRRLSPEGQLRALTRIVERGKAKGDKAFDGVEKKDLNEAGEIILGVYNEDGTFDQKKLDAAVEEAKQQIADKMKVTNLEKTNAWRYLSMLGNPKTHARNFISNAANFVARIEKNAIARAAEDIAPVIAPKWSEKRLETRTKTWLPATDDVKAFAKRTTEEMLDVIKGENKYSEGASIKAKRKIWESKAFGWLNKVSDFNTKALEWEDSLFSKYAFKRTLQEYLTANGISNEADIKNNTEIVKKAKNYALEEAYRATFRQDSYIAKKIGEIEQKSPIHGVIIGSTMPFKKTPINVAKTGLAYSPLGIARNIYDAAKVHKGEMDASEAIDHIAQTVTGTSLMMVGAFLASLGVLNGAGSDDKEGKYDYQLGKQTYSFSFGGDSYSLSWLSPAAMPLFVGVNAYEQLVEGKEWDMNMVIDALGQTLDPLSEMSFVSSLNDVLSSYDDVSGKIWGAGESMAQNYATQFIPTLSSQIASIADTKKRSTQASRDSGFTFVEETLRKMAYKVPVARNLLEPTTDIWGEEVEQGNFIQRAWNSLLNPANKREGIETAVDTEIKDLYRQTGDAGLIPSIPYSYFNYDGEKYEMSADEYTEFKQEYGQTAYSLLETLFDTDTYRAATSEERAEMVNKIYDYARDEARKSYLAGLGVDFTNATAEDEEYYKENAIVGALEADLPVDEYTFSVEYPEKYEFFKENGISYETYRDADEDGKRAYSWAYENPGKYTLSKAITDDFMEYYSYKSEMNDFDAKDENGETVSGLKKERVSAYINGLNLDYGQKMILYRSMYDSKEDQKTYNKAIVEYLNSRNDISYEQGVTILKELGMTVRSDGTVTW